MRHSRETPCYKAFIAGQQARARSPLSSGAYKLKEAQRSVHHYLESIYAIREYLLNQRKFYKGAPLGRCTTYDKATYLKRMPEGVAELLGYDVLPAILALGADGLSQREIRSEYEIAEERSLILLKNCEAQYHRLRSGIGGEYQDIKRGYSNLVALLDDAQLLIESPLGLLKWNERQITRS